MIYLVCNQGKENPKPEGENIMKCMKTVDIMKWGKGYYVTMRQGCNVQREWVKTKKAAETLKTQWERA